MRLHQRKRRHNASEEQLSAILKLLSRLCLNGSHFYAPTQIPELVRGIWKNHTLILDEALPAFANPELPSDAVRAALHHEIYELDKRLFNPQGCTMDPDLIIEHLDALARGRLTLRPSSVLKPVTPALVDWSDPESLKLGALGLIDSVLTKLSSAARVTSIGELLRLSELGLNRAVGTLGLTNRQLTHLNDKLRAHRLKLAESNDTVRLSYAERLIGQGRPGLYNLRNAAREGRLPGLQDWLESNTLGDLKQMSADTVQAQWGGLTRREAASIVRDFTELATFFEVSPPITQRPTGR